jgi:hypothetical protein
MTYLNELKHGDFARIVEIEDISDSTECFPSIRLLEGCFIVIVSCFGNIVFTSERKTFVVSKNLAKKIRVIILD